MLIKNHQMRVYSWLYGVLFLLAIVELFALASVLTESDRGLMSDSVRNLFHFVTLIILVIVLYFRQSDLSKLSGQTESGERQVKAMWSMFSAVRHDLNNDMQVVVGNAELAQLQIESGGNLRKPVDNIAEAATLAVERIEQLSVFTNSGLAARNAIDLNATLRESMAKLATELPAIVVLHLELEHLPIRVLADRYLLGLSLSHLIRQTARTMQHGGEIEIRTTDLSRHEKNLHSAVVDLQIFIVRAYASATDPASYRENSSDDDVRLCNEFDTAKALVERSGAIMVAHSVSQGGSLINMRFVSDEHGMSPTRSDMPLMGQSII